MNKKANIPWEVVENRLAELKKDQQWLREELQLSPNVVTNWKNRGVPSGKAVAVARILELSTDQLLGLESYETVAGASRVQAVERGDPSYVHIKKVKLRLSAGVTGFQADPEFDSGGTVAVDPRWIARNGYSPDRLIAIKVHGQSMEPTLYEEDLVILNTADKAMIDGVVYAFNYEGQAVVKRLSRDAGEWWLTSDNPDQRKYHRKLCRGGDCIIVGRVVRKESDHI
ncbi:Peptidase S24-like [Janthinobacterium sp. OK676]|uniref:S24 family peptidase n=1 Tax=Janthinobacterium sp. OK676 TaxID=1855295 RepID=UPI000889DB7E|nr:S24 family peptidase [Janthinobacterium sp. OK676]SDM78406.1 Peptidase S24-like [Janthinobacterium sp. OK676]